MFSRFLSLFLTLAGATSIAAEVSVRAQLERGSSVIGDPVKLQIKISGARHIGNPPDIAVDGLDIRYTNQSTEPQIRSDNGTLIRELTTTLIYQVVPQRNGSFTIPAVTVESDGKSYSTKPVSLAIQPRSTTNDQMDAGETGFAEIVVPKKTLYVGEAIPVELRLYVDAQIRWQPTAMPDLESEGFTKQKMPDPHKKEDPVVRNGKDYDLVIFRTVIAPIRAGDLTIGPSEIPFVAQIPRPSRSGGRRLPFDIFGGTFGDSFFTVQQKLTAKAEPMHLTVKPLPLAGKPSDFSGAVGKFEFSAEGTPNQVMAGDPITMKMKISGRGNFDRVSAPIIGETTGWRTYLPSNTFTADDPVKYSGTKTFEEAVIPETQKTTIPVFNFSFFDPAKGQYVTLNSEATPLQVEGFALPTPRSAPLPEDIVDVRFRRGTPNPEEGDAQKVAEAETQAAEEGKMTPQQARNLLESLRGEDVRVQILKPSAESLAQKFRNW